MLSTLVKLIPAGGVPYIGVAVLIAAFWAGFEWRDRSADLDLAELEADYNQAVLDAKDVAAAKELEMRRRSEAIGQRDAARRALRDAQSETTTKEVIRYVQGNSSGGCNLPGEWVRIHDQSARMPETPETPRVPDGAARPIKDAKVLRVVTANYRTCAGVADRLELLQDYVRGLEW